jgi:hypothetical protein
MNTTGRRRGKKSPDKVNLPKRKVYLQRKNLAFRLTSICTTARIANVAFPTLRVRRAVFAVFFGRF